MCMFVRTAIAEGWGLQSLLFASSSALEKMVFSKRLTKVLGTFSSPSSSLPFHTQVGAMLVGAPASSGVVDKEGQHSSHIAGLCVSTQLGEVHLGAKVIFHAFLLLLCYTFAKLVGESTAKIPVRVSASCVHDL